MCTHPAPVEAGGDDEFQGKVEYTFTRPDGTELGPQGAIALSFRDIIVGLTAPDIQHTVRGYKTVSAAP